MTAAAKVSLAEALTMLTAPDAPFAMTHCMIAGRAVRCYAKAPANLRTLFLRSPAAASAPYLSFEDEQLSYGAVRRDAAAFAAALHQEFGVGKGDRIAICMRNFPEWAIAYWAAMLLGAIVVPVNAWGTGAEMAYVVEHSTACLVIADPERLARLRPFLPSLSLRAVIGVRNEAEAAAADDAIAFTALVQRHHASAAPPDPMLLPDDDATLLYTSGTTGKPKGAVGSHRNAISCILSGRFNTALSHVRRTGALPGQDADSTPPPYLYGGPLFHVGGCNSGLAATMAAGAHMVMMHRWDAGRALHLIEALRIGGIGAVPTMIWQLLDHPEFSHFDLSSLQSLAIGGAAAGPELHARIARQLPWAVAATGYGATETSGGCTFNGGLDYAADPAGVGVAAPILDVKCVGSDGAEVPPGAPGELCLRGASVVRGYWRDEAATAAAFRDGWYHSGDIARVDADGRITILDRVKDMVIRGGENIYSIEVEDALMAHPAVLGAAVFGIPDAILGERVAAVVHLAPDARNSPEDIKAHAATRLAYFKVPSVIALTHQPLPKNETGKIQKRDLRSELIEQLAKGPA
jgi:long-chain acyl-CoA synthetase